MKAIIALSGGLDSVVTLAVALSEGRSVQCVGFNYGSKHGRFERGAARRIALHYNVPYRVVNMISVMSGFKSALLESGADIPEGHYEEETMRRTVVPARNMIFLSILAGIAVSEEAEEIWIGTHAGDHFIYPDCRPEFLRSMAEAIRQGTGQGIQLRTPFMDAKKDQILRDGLRMNVPVEMTRTCYKAQRIACGKCGSCQERLEAFLHVGRDDPIEYETRSILEKQS